MTFLDEKVAGYMRDLTIGRFDDEVMNEMERVGLDEGFPIIGRTVGACIEMLATAIGATRVFEMGSGYGFSAYWFAKAVGQGGEVHLTDGDPANAAKAESYLKRAGLWDRCEFHVGDAIETLAATAGDFDVIYCDIDKGDYPRAFEAAKDRIRPGGMYICDNVLWSGRVAGDDDDEWTQAIRDQNTAIYAEAGFLPVIIPIRDGVIAALKTS